MFTVKLVCMVKHNSLSVRRKTHTHGNMVESVQLLVHPHARNIASCYKACAINWPGITCRLVHELMSSSNKKVR